MPNNKSPTGPYLSAAFFCDRTLLEQDGVMSVIRIIDRITATTSEQLDPKNLPPIPISTNLFVLIKSGDFVGEGVIKVRGEKPSGDALKPLVAEAPVKLDGDVSGATAVFQMQLLVSEQGTYWFEVYFDDRWLTRIPLAVHVATPENQTTE